MTLEDSLRFWRSCIVFFTYWGHCGVVSIASIGNLLNIYSKEDSFDFPIMPQNFSQAQYLCKLKTAIKPLVSLILTHHKGLDRNI